MKNTREYTINFAEKEIIVTKKFYKAANIYGSDAYEIMTGLVKDFPEYTITAKTIDKKENKVSYSGLTVYKMQAAVQVIAGVEKAEFFQKQAKVYEGEKGKYATVKKIFLTSYKEKYKKLTIDEMVEVDRIAKELKAKAEAAKKAEEEAKKEAERAEREKKVAGENTEADKEDEKVMAMPEAAPQFDKVM